MPTQPEQLCAQSHLPKIGMPKILQPTYWILLVMLMFASSISLAQTNKVLIYTFEYPPLTFANGTGISSRLVEAAFSKQGASVRFEYVPVKRAIHMSEKGLGHYLGVLTHTQLDGVLALVPLLDVQATLIFIPARFNISKQQSPSDALTNRTIGLLRGYESNPLVEKYGMRLEQPSTQNSALEMFRVGRFDFLPCIKHIECPSMLNKLNALGVKAVELPFDVAPKFSVGLIYRTDNATLTQQADQFAKGLASIKRDGSFARILKSEFATNQ
jgi:hypothetical protein